MTKLQTNIERLGHWVALYQDQLYRYAFFRLGNRGDAEDVLQEAFLKVASSTTDIRNPKAYLYRAVASGCVDMLRRRTHTLPIDKGVGLQAEGPADEAEEEFRRINNLLKELPEQQSEVIRLHIYGQMKFTEIAEMLSFDTPQYFSKCFKKYSGLTPSEYKSSII